MAKIMWGAMRTTIDIAGHLFVLALAVVLAAVPVSAEDGADASQGDETPPAAADVAPPVEPLVDGTTSQSTINRWQDGAAKAAAALRDKPSEPTSTSAGSAPGGTGDQAAATPPDVQGAAGAPPTKTEPIPAKKLFGTQKSAAPLEARAIGAYSKGCLAGAKALDIDGPAWQAMRLSRNRNWGHPKLIALVERFATEVKEKDGWPGLLVGDISQPRGGPMLTGHASHQLGLDADIWFTPMPKTRLSKAKRESLAATSMLANDNLSVNTKVWGEGQHKIIKRAASYPDVERVLVHPAIKKALCEKEGGNAPWLAKVRPIWGHFYHFHIRMGCPKDSPGCKAQPPPPNDSGCTKELDDWFKLLTAPPPKPSVPVKPVKPKPPLFLADLPADCQTVLAAGTEPEKPSATAPASAGAAAPSGAAAPDAKPAETGSVAAPRMTGTAVEKSAKPQKPQAAKKPDKPSDDGYTGPRP